MTPAIIAAAIIGALFVAVCFLAGIASSLADRARRADIREENTRRQLDNVGFERDELRRKLHGAKEASGEAAAYWKGEFEVLHKKHEELKAKVTP
jgi:hypothetical protein